MGPTAPPAKSFMDSGVIIDFSDSTTHHDRVLLIDGQKFHVQSSLLSQFSEFFNALFNSNFKEKNEETIELNDVTAEDFDNFLRALYPTRFQVTGENLPVLVQLSIRFLCPTVWCLCLEFLKNKDEFNKFSTRELLQWSQGSDSHELKRLIEEDLIEKSIIYGEKGLAELVEFLLLSTNYSSDKLKELLKEFIFKDSRREMHPSYVDLLYYSEKYDLSIARKLLDDYFSDFHFEGPGQVHISILLLKICRLPIFEVKVFEHMLQLVNNMNEDKKFPPLEPVNYGEIEQLKNLAVDYLCNMYARIDKTQEVVGNFLQIGSQYNVFQLQKEVEADLVNHFLNKKGLEYMNLAVKYNLLELMDLMAEYLSGTDSSEISVEDHQTILNSTHKSLAADPAACTVSAAGGNSTHQLANSGAEKLVFKVKSSNNNEYRIKPVFGFVEPGASTSLPVLVEPLRRTSWSSNSDLPQPTPPMLLLLLKPLLPLQLEPLLFHYRPLLRQEIQ